MKEINIKTFKTGSGGAPMECDILIGEDRYYVKISNDIVEKLGLARKRVVIGYDGDSGDFNDLYLSESPDGNVVGRTAKAGCKTSWMISYSALTEPVCEALGPSVRYNHRESYSLGGTTWHVFSRVTRNASFIREVPTKEGRGRKAT